MSNFLLAASPALTVALVLTRPRLVGRRIGPAEAALAGALLMMLSGFVSVGDLPKIAATLWRPLVGLASIMVLAGVAERSGVLDRLATIVERGTKGPVWVAFFYTFVLAAVAATVFNNDSAILVLTPVIAKLVKRRYPLRPYLAVPFAFAVFYAAGVAPLAISNPINYVVVTHAHIGFNEYAARMIPVALAGGAASLAMLAWVYRKELSDRIPGRGPEAPPLPPVRVGEKRTMTLLAVVLIAYPIVSWTGGPIWVVSLAGAIAGCFVAVTCKTATVPVLARHVTWSILVFLTGIFVIARGLETHGFTDAIGAAYASFAGPAQVFVVGGLSSISSAMLNNHAVAVLNAVALEGSEQRLLLAALVGGDLGPRLLPMGSLAALLWLDLLRRADVEVTVREFVRVGALVTGPALLASLAVLLAVA